jgi:hypothetical protein
MAGTIRVLTGTEETVVFAPGDEFTGVNFDWLAPRLRLNPAASPVDLMIGMVIYLDDDFLDIPDGDLIQDITDVIDVGPHDGELVSYGNGGVIGGRFDIRGGWVEDSAPEVRHALTHIGEAPDLHALARAYLVTGFDCWEPQDHELCEVDSPYLSADNPGDVDVTLAVACRAGVVRLNGTVLRGA